jgi:hypothetical protein
MTLQTVSLSHPLALAESGWVWVGAGSRPALPVRQNTRQGREGGALPDPCSQFRQDGEP